MMELDTRSKPNGSAVYRTIPNGYALPVSLARNIRVLRKAAGLNQTELGQQMGVGQGAVSRWETAETRPQVEELPRLARILDASIDDLLVGIDLKYDASRGNQSVKLLQGQIRDLRGRADKLDISTTMLDEVCERLNELVAFAEGARRKIRA